MHSYRAVKIYLLTTCDKGNEKMVHHHHPYYPPRAHVIAYINDKYTIYLYIHVLYSQLLILVPIQFLINNDQPRYTFLQYTLCFSLSMVEVYLCYARYTETVCVRIARKGLRSLQMQIFSYVYSTYFIHIKFNHTYITYTYIKFEKLYQHILIYQPIRIYKQHNEKKSLFTMYEDRTI